LKFLGNFVDFHDFVAGGDNGDGGTAVDFDARMSDGGKQRDIGVVQSFAGVQDHLMGRRLTASRIDKLLRFGGAVDDYAPVFAPRVLDHDDGVGAGRDWCAGHDLHRLSGGEPPGETLAGAHFTDDFEAAGEIDRAHGIPITHRPRERGRVSVRLGVAGKNAPGGICQGDLLYGWKGAPVAHGAEYGFASIGKG
jgi:hypothetical protein